MNVVFRETRYSGSPMHSTVMEQAENIDTCLRVVQRVSCSEELRADRPV